MLWVGSVSNCTFSSEIILELKSGLRKYFDSDHSDPRQEDRSDDRGQSKYKDLGESDDKPNKADLGQSDDRESAVRQI